jgi:chorismate mutase
MKNRLDHLRNRILDIDGDLVRLLSERARLALEIGRIKSDLGIPVQDPEREREVLNHVKGIPHDPIATSQIEALFIRILEICREAQIQSAVATGGGRP